MKWRACADALDLNLDGPLRPVEATRSWTLEAQLWIVGSWDSCEKIEVMPLFEYECRGCGQQFEYLTREGQSPSCPSCEGANLQKLLSVFAVSTKAGNGDPAPFPASTGACGSCGDPRGPGSCSIN